MKNTIYMIAILLFGLLAFACGGKTETEKVSTANLNAVNSVSPGNANLAVNSDNTVPVNSNTGISRDTDDMRAGNTNQKRIDRDDINGKRDADDKRQSANSRQDADDFNKQRNDRDDGDDH